MLKLLVFLSVVLGASACKDTMLIRDGGVAVDAAKKG